MPIYAYRCEACGFAKDTLQKMSDAPLTICPSCHKDAFKKQLTTAGFQLKGSGWYVTDFRGGEKALAPSTDGASAAGSTTAPAATATTAAATVSSTVEAAKPAASTSTSTSNAGAASSSPASST